MSEPSTTRSGRAAWLRGELVAGALVALLAIGLVVLEINSKPPPRLFIPEEVFALPEVKAWPNSCASVGIPDATLVGHHDMTTAVIWLQQPGTRIDVIFPPGYQVWFPFRQPFEIIDVNGRTVAREGDKVTAGCVTGPNAAGPLLILAP